MDIPQLASMPRGEFEGQCVLAELRRQVDRLGSREGHDRHPSLASTRSLKSSLPGGRAIETLRPSPIHLRAAAREAITPTGSGSHAMTTLRISGGRISERMPPADSAAHVGVPVTS